MQNIKKNSVAKNVQTCKQANSKLIYAKKLSRFVRLYFNGKTPTKEEWNDFFTILLEAYSVGKDTLPNIEIQDFSVNGIFDNVFDNIKNVQACFNSSKKQIIVSSKIIDMLNERTYSLLSCVDILMHEFRHFYQFQAAHVQFQGFYKKVFKENSSKLRRGLKVFTPSNTNQIKEMFDLIHEVTDKCSFIEESLSLNDEEKEKLFRDISFGCYYNVPHEIDARINGDHLQKAFYRDMLESLDDDIQDLLIKDFCQSQDKKDNLDEYMKDIDEKYAKLVETLKSLTIEQLNKICQNAEKTLSGVKIFWGLLGIITNNSTREERLNYLFKLIDTKHYVLCSKFYKVLDLDKEEKNIVGDYLLKKFKDGKKVDELNLMFCVNSDLISHKKLKIMITHAIENQDYISALLLYYNWTIADELKGQDEFADSMAKSLYCQAQKLLQERETKKNKTNILTISKILKKILDDGYFIDDKEKIIELLSIIGKKYSEKGNEHSL